MANEVCKYNNDFNTVSMRNWTTEEMNFLMVVLAKLKNQGNKTIRIQKNELVELANYSERNNKKLYNIMDKLSDHVTNLKFTDRTKGIKKWFCSKRLNGHGMKTQIITMLKLKLTMI